VLAQWSPAEESQPQRMIWSGVDGCRLQSTPPTSTGGVISSLAVAGILPQAPGTEWLQGWGGAHPVY
jgi:hypothetical protein